MRAPRPAANGHQDPKVVRVREEHAGLSRLQIARVWRVVAVGGGKVAVGGRVDVGGMRVGVAVFVGTVVGVGVGSVAPMLRLVAVLQLAPA